MLGKRARPPMKRTTSMTEFMLNFNAGAEGVSQPLDPHNPFNGGSGSAAASSRLNRRNSGDFVETANFLRVCFLCKRRLIPARDSAFCSLECRQQQMSQDERKEKQCSLTSNKVAATTAAAGPQANNDQLRTIPD
ncbi:hypothetical protein BUALT_Bualt08G0025600 [Buddleja alternifolia]|uniref:FLZ-type domain-containing protein n=1 Tax=Buddleja alternifolia TaxID=168488 RepID=A0AAV6X2F9_9LAMI|nr:hypothetical protein BUALT_Bualt08G0025600 [Buddleja alternifolia]